jgi:TRAP transporter TAXI family solute receptor
VRRRRRLSAPITGRAVEGSCDYWAERIAKRLSEESTKGAKKAKNDVYGMHIQTKHLSSRAVLLVGIAMLSGAPVLAGDEMISIGAGNVMGVYYAAGSGMAKIFNHKRQEYHQWFVTVASLGSVENINNVLQGKVEFGLAQANMLDRAVRGREPWTVPQTNLQAVLSLYTEDFTIVAAGDAGIEALADLKGKRVNIGAPGSSDGVYAREVLEKSGVRVEDVEISEQPSFKASDLLSEGKIDAYFFTAGHPNLSVREVTSGKRKARLLPLDQSLIEQFLAARPLLKAVSISTDYYPGLENRAAVPTVGVKVVLFTREGMTEETVYRLVKEVMTHLDLFRRQQPALAGLTAEEMAAVQVLPLHPGAVRYFREAGLVP